MTDEQACPREDLLAGLLAQALSPEEEVALEAHLAGCAVCRETLEADRAAGAALRALPLPEPSPEAATRAYQAILAATIGRSAEASAPVASPPRKAAAPITKMPAPRPAAVTGEVTRTWQLTRVLGWAAAACIVVVVGVEALGPTRHPAERADTRSNLARAPQSAASTIAEAKPVLDSPQPAPPAPLPGSAPEAQAQAATNGAGLASAEPRIGGRSARGQGLDALESADAAKETTRRIGTASEEGDLALAAGLTEARGLLLEERYGKARRESRARDDEQRTPRDEDALKKNDADEGAAKQYKSEDGKGGLARDRFKDKAPAEEPAEKPKAKALAPAAPPPTDPTASSGATPSAEPAGPATPRAAVLRKSSETKKDAPAKAEPDRGGADAPATEAARQAPRPDGFRFRQDARVILVERDGARAYYVEDRAVSGFAGKADAGAAPITSWAEIPVDDAATRAALRAVLDAEVRAQPHDVRWAERVFALARVLGIDAGERAGVERAAAGAKRAEPEADSPAPAPRPALAK
jgi:hypothetical protein